MSTFSELKYNVSYEMGLDQTASGVDDTLLGRRLNEGVRQVLLDTHCRVAIATTSLTANESDYDLPVDALAIHKIVTSELRPLEQKSTEEIHEMRRGGASIAATDVFFYAVDANLLMLYPTPSSSGSLTLYFVQRPTEMSSASHDPSNATYGGIPVEFHEAIEFWAAYRMGMRMRHEPSAFGQSYKQQYDLFIREMRADMVRKGGRLPRASVGRRRVYRTSPSQDL